MRPKRRTGLLLMQVPVSVQIIGAPIFCKEGVKDSWREVAEWAEGQLEARFGDAIQVQYFDMFDPNCPSMPPDVQLPLVMVNDQVLTSGGKISVPAIRKRLQELGL